MRNNSKIPYGSHWLQCFLELRLLQKTAMLGMSAEWEVEPSMRLLFLDIYWQKEIWLPFLYNAATIPGHLQQNKD